VGLPDLSRGDSDRGALIHAGVPGWLLVEASDRRRGHGKPDRTKLRGRDDGRWKTGRSANFRCALPVFVAICSFLDFLLRSMIP
jgi:hypothetical protein